MAKIHCYDVSELDREQLERHLAGAGDVAYTQEQLTVHSADADCEVAAVFINSKVTDEVMAAMPKLKLVACRSTGFNNVDLAAATKRGVTVVNVPTYGENTVAEYAFALLLAVVRRLPQAMDSFAHGQASHDMLRGVDLRGKTLGVVGAGHIGCNMAQIGVGFGMKVLAYDPYPAPERAGQYGFEYAELDAVLAHADFVSLHVPLLPSTRHLLNASKFALMKPSAYLVNTSRGEIVDTRALVEALGSNKLGGVALDVFEGEELVDVDSEMQILREEKPDPMMLLESLELDILKKQPNVIITNHNGFNTAEAIERINEVSAENIKKYLGGETQNAVKVKS